MMLLLLSTFCPDASFSRSHSQLSRSSDRSQKSSVPMVSNKKLLHEFSSGSSSGSSKDHRAIEQAFWIIHGPDGPTAIVDDPDDPLPVRTTVAARRWHGHETSNWWSCRSEKVWPQEVGFPPVLPVLLRLPPDSWQCAVVLSRSHCASSVAYVYGRELLLQGEPEFA